MTALSDCVMLQSRIEDQDIDGKLRLNQCSAKLGEWGRFEEQMVGWSVAFDNHLRENRDHDEYCIVYVETQQGYTKLWTIIIQTGWASASSFKSTLIGIIEIVERCENSERNAVLSFVHNIGEA